MLSLSKLWRSGKSKSDDECTPNYVPEGDNTSGPVATKETINLLESVFKCLGCKYTYDDERQEYKVRFQGEDFLIIVYGRMAHIWDTWWEEVKLDSPMVPLIKKTINRVNVDKTLTIVYRESEEDNSFSLHTHQTIMLHPMCPDNVNYVEFVLNSFFDTQKRYYAIYRAFEQREYDLSHGWYNPN
jgi:hypothetical protein